MASTINYNNTTPTAPTGGVNVLWQNDNSNPPNISASVKMVPLVVNYNTTAQSQTVVSDTTYYIAGSFLPAPNPAINGPVVGTTYTWRVHMTKTAVGTGIFQIFIYMGTAGTTGDTAEVSQTIGTQTGAVDQMDMDVSVTWTAVGSSTASFYWSICPRQFASSATGFGITWPATASFFSGTVSSLNSTTAGLGLGLAFSATGGTPTIVIPYVESQAINLN